MGMSEGLLVARAMTIKRLTPDEVTRLHQTELREKVPIDYDPETQTCKGFKKRWPHALASWEIISAFKMGENKFHYGYSGIREQAEVVSFFKNCWKQIETQVVPRLKMVEHYCRNCQWYQTTFDGDIVDGDREDHGAKCFGPVRADSIFNVETGEVAKPELSRRGADIRPRHIPNQTAKLCALMSESNVPAMHWFDTAILEWGGKLDLRYKGAAKSGGRASRLMSALRIAPEDERQGERRGELGLEG